jgi:hypothetical protein
MPTFVLESISPFNCSIRFFKLIENEKCLFDESWEEIERSGGHESDLDAIQSIILRKSREEPVAPKLWQELSRNKKDNIKDYEIRKGRLRFYFFKDEGVGIIGVLGAIKNPKNQDKEISKLRKIKDRYFEWKAKNIKP